MPGAEKKPPFILLTGPTDQACGARTLRCSSTVKSIKTTIPIPHHQGQNINTFFQGLLNDIFMGLVRPMWIEKSRLNFVRTTVVKFLQYVVIIFNTVNSENIRIEYVSPRFLNYNQLQVERFKFYQKKYV
jgi:hypothetical protein